MNETQLLKAARDGDERAYAALVETHRGPLYAHCYQMLGSVHDADDAVQETLLKAWRALARFEGRSSPRTWLYMIATNVCLRMIGQRPFPRVLPMDYGPPADPHDGLGAPLLESREVQPVPDRELGLGEGLAGPEARYEQREAIELAFIAALQHLPARQRAVLILRDVLGFSGAEVADVLQTTATSVYSCFSARTRPSTTGCRIAANRRRSGSSTTGSCARSSTATPRRGLTTTWTRSSTC
ncbi:MAG TPA: RNA polymerase subunit sigma-70 [Solirubrobacteraceae bacterium]|jgi:RNA polymerase sigma-70 factor (ECF subfamily)|nr:RNA polymerase subunit sigma-70 [Solirubrobacteraceae bacterium]